MKKFWQIILSIGSLLAMILGIVAMMTKGETVGSAKAKQNDIRREAEASKQKLRLEAEEEKKRLTARTPEEVLEEYYISHPKVDRTVNIEKHVNKAMKLAKKYVKESS